MTEADLLKGTLISTPQQGKYNKYQITLEEKNNDNHYSVIITGVPLNSILIKLDENKIDVSGFFGRSSNDGINKKADYILIDNECQKILFIELKSGNFGHQYVQQQLTGAKCLFKYMCYLMEEFSHIKPFNQYSHKYFAIAKQYAKKRSYHAKKEQQMTLGDTTDKFRIIQMKDTIRYRDFNI